MSLTSTSALRGRVGDIALASLASGTFRITVGAYIIGNYQQCVTRTTATVPPTTAPGPLMPSRPLSLRRQ